MREGVQAKPVRKGLAGNVYSGCVLAPQTGLNRPIQPGIRKWLPVSRYRNPAQNDSVGLINGHHDEPCSHEGQRADQTAVAPLFSRNSENISIARKGKSSGYGENSPTHRRRLSRTKKKSPGMTRNSPSWKRKIPVSSETLNPKLLQQTTAHFQHLRPCSRPTASHRHRSDAASLAGRRGTRAPAVPHPCESTKPSSILSRNVPSAARPNWGNRAESTSGLSGTYPPRPTHGDGTRLL